MRLGPKKPTLAGSMIVIKDYTESSNHAAARLSWRPLA